MGRLVVVSHPLLQVALTRIRDRETGIEGFRRAITTAARILAVEATRDLPVKRVSVRTPIRRTSGSALKHGVVLVPVLRAGVSMLEAFLEALPDAAVGFVGQKRDERTLEPRNYLFNVPQPLGRRRVVVLDPMLATGGSSSATVAGLKERGAKDLVCVHLLAAPEGVERFVRDHPDVPLFVGALDSKLNGSGFIVPGLGDAGDRCFGT